MFSVNPKKAARSVKSYKESRFSKKVFKHFITLLQQRSDKRDTQLFFYFGYKKSIEKFQIYQKKKAFHLNKAHYLKPYIGSSVYKDQKLQCVEECKYTSSRIVNEVIRG